MPRRRKRPRGYHRPELSVGQILRWADAWFERRGQWPKRDSGFIPDTGGDKWSTVDDALKRGWRGLPGGTTLGLLLAAKRNAPYLWRVRRETERPPRLSVEQILSWADAHHARTGAWPVEKSGPVVDAPYHETWLAITSALRDGGRGLRGGSSIANLLHKHRGVRNAKRLPRLTIKEILAWADAHFERAGKWPQRYDGKIEGTAETWQAVDAHIRRGNRGLPGGSSLAEFLARHRHIPNRFTRPRLTEELILSWVDDHFGRTGRWPTTTSGPVLAAPREKWGSIDIYLRGGMRGLPGGSSLYRLLAASRGPNATKRCE